MLYVLFIVQYSLFSGGETARFAAIIYLDKKFFDVQVGAWFEAASKLAGEHLSSEETYFL